MKGCRRVAVSLLLVLIVFHASISPVLASNIGTDQVLDTFQPDVTIVPKPQLVPQNHSGSVQNQTPRNPDGSVVGSPFENVPDSQLTTEQVAAKYGVTVGQLPKQTFMQKLNSFLVGVFRPIGNTFISITNWFSGLYGKITGKSVNAKGGGKSGGKGGKKVSASVIPAKAGVPSKSSSGDSCSKSLSRSLYESSPGWMQWVVNKTTGAPSADCKKQSDSPTISKQVTKKVTEFKKSAGDKLNDAWNWVSSFFVKSDSSHNSETGGGIDCSTLKSPTCGKVLNNPKADLSIKDVNLKTKKYTLEKEQISAPELTLVYLSPDKKNVLVYGLIFKKNDSMKINVKYDDKTIKADIKQQCSTSWFPWGCEKVKGVFRPKSPGETQSKITSVTVKLYRKSDNKYLGDATVNPDGTFNAVIPAGQNGISMDNEIVASAVINGQIVTKDLKLDVSGTSINSQSLAVTEFKIQNRGASAEPVVLKGKVDRDFGTSTKIPQRNPLGADNMSHINATFYDPSYTARSTPHTGIDYKADYTCADKKDPNSKNSPLCPKLDDKQKTDARKIYDSAQSIKVNSQCDNDSNTPTDNVVVYATHDGVVSHAYDGSDGAVLCNGDKGYTYTAANGGGFGIHAKIMSDDGTISTIYGHLKEVFVKDGDYVVAGTPIGLMGSTGDSGGRHLHYEIQKNGVPVDPSTYVKN